MELVLINPEMKARIWKRLNEEVKICVREAAQKDDPPTTTRSVSAVHTVILKAFAEVGLNDPEDLWNLLLTSIADEYWCEIHNEWVDEQEEGR